MRHAGRWRELPRRAGGEAAHSLQCAMSVAMMSSDSLMESVAPGSPPASAPGACTSSTGTFLYLPSSWAKRIPRGVVSQNALSQNVLSQNSHTPADEPGQLHAADMI